MKLSSVYSPSDYESDIYSLWELGGSFKPKGKGEPFTMVMPPPNANASLHIGHVLGFGIDDTIIRFMRMRGRDTLWLPGADHAGFETQVVYEKHLAKEGKSRFDFTREELYGRIYEFVGQNRENFNNIFRRLGASCDWSRFTFTLDEKSVKTAYSTFKKLWEEGYIYRGERLVNYCTFHRTGFADIEVEYEDQETPLYYLKYGPFTLATTRPETKFGDTGIAVNPTDERYKQYIGQTITIDGLNGPVELRVVADDMVDTNFGTGVVKITPAHDFNDWEVAQRHNLEPIRIINHDGTLNHRAGKYEGMSVVEARKAVVKDLDDRGLLVKVDKNYKNRVAKCYKCGTTIEPMLLDQWFVDMKRLSLPAIDALEKGRVTFYPDQKRQQTIDYLKTVKDWNISRQIAWGIPIPAFQNVDDPDDWIFDERVDQELIEIDGKTYHRDPDVFDTWFSSGQWPFITTGYPDSPDFKRYYPTTLMEPGIDILYQWVSRMLSLGLFVTGELPFKEVYLHGMVRATDGTKMSKSKGNVVDPVPILDEYGADAVRMGMIAGRSAGDSAAFDHSKIVSARNFCNKLWNVARFCELMLGEQKPNVGHAKAESSADHWIAERFNQAQSEIASLLEEYRFSEAYERLYHFVWGDFADWYVEASKTELNKDFLMLVLENVLKISHPFAPFVTETIWQTLDATGEDQLISKSWPDDLKFDKSKAAEFSEISKIIVEVRAITKAMSLEKTNLYHSDSESLDTHAKLIEKMAGVTSVKRVSDGEGLKLTSTKYNCWIDVDRSRAAKYASKLENDRSAAQKRLEALQNRLENKNYVDKAPKELVEQTKSQITDLEQQIETITSEIGRYGS